MARTLDVFLHRELVGHLIQDDGGQMVFDYAESWLNEPDATPLSHSLPLRRERFKRNECRGYFAGVLPEESKREIIARNLGISKRNDYAMLERIGGECAGAVTFIPAKENLSSQNLPAPDDHYRALRSSDGQCDALNLDYNPDGSINFFVGEVFSNRGFFSPCIEIGAEPVYAEVPGLAKRPYWPSVLQAYEL